jgi:outer membrane protein TolC
MKHDRRNVIFLLCAALFGEAAQGSFCAAQQPAPVRLTLQDAIHKALLANLNVLAAGTRVEEDEGARTRSLSAALLPRVNAQVYANYQNRDLRAFGIELPAIPGFAGLPNVVGPFSNYDFRVYAQQNIVDIESYRALKASDRALDADEMDEQDARDLIVRVVAGLYLNAQSAQARVLAAESRVTDSTTLLKLATDKHAAGTATGVDVLRAQVQLANDKQALLEAQNQYTQSLLELARNLGMSPGTPLELAEPLRFQALAEPPPEDLLPAALAARADYLSLDRHRQSLMEQQRANRARFYPRLSINGNIGELGRSIGGVATTGLIQGQIDFTVFDRDREGEAQQLAARMQRIDDQIADLRRGVEEDVRAALLNLESAAEQVSVAADGQNLARRELEMARDRFQVGTANNVEVVTAQDELARAQENYILAVSSHVDAKFALARALGYTEKYVLEFSANP